MPAIMTCINLVYDIKKFPKMTTIFPISNGKDTIHEV